MDNINNDFVAKKASDGEKEISNAKPIERLPIEY